jgi:hypothetical protein
MHIPWRRLVVPGLAVIVSAAAPLFGQAAGPANPTAANQPTTLRFKRFVITDNTRFVGMEISRGIVPADWNVQGGLVWLAYSVYPGQFRIHFCDAQDISAMDIYPMRVFSWYRRNPLPQGQVYIGRILWPPPQDQFEALEKVVIPQDRKDLLELHARVINKENMQDLAKAIEAREPQSPNYPITAMVGRETFEYELRGQTVDEVMNIVYEYGVNQFNGTVNWKVCNVSSFRGPKGTLDQLDQLRAVMAQSVKPNQDWYDQVNQFVAQELHQTVNNLNAQQQRREAAMKAQQAANDAEEQRFQQHMADLDNQSNAEADIQREVSPWKDGDGNTYRLPNQYGNAWMGADGQIIMNNDPRYNPASDPNLTPTQWTPMQQAGN